MGDPESEKPRRKFSRVWKDFAQNDKIFPKIWKVPGQSRSIQDSLEDFPDSLESFLTVWKVSSQSGQFPDSLVSFRTV